MSEQARVEKAIALFKEGFSCSQAVLAAYSEQLGLEQETAMKLSAGFGGGMKMAGTCGALTGGLMVIGLKHGHSEAEDKEGKKKLGELIKDFTARFKTKARAVTCRELMNCDISTQEGLRVANEMDLFSVVCPKAVRAAAQILEEMLF
jgi:C_GCAxxG_C_C family probable redox protein